MTTLLQLNTSLYSGAGQSTRLADRFVSAWREAQPAAEVVVRDFSREPVPHLDAQRFQAFSAKPGERTAEQRAAAEYSDRLIDELRRADVIVLGLPMYNFGVPSQLKAYFDHIARAGVTFSYGANGPVGLLTGRKAYVFATRGGLYQGTPRDTETQYVRDFLAFIGIADVEFVYAEGLAMGEAVAQMALQHAHATIATLVAPERLAA